MQKSKTKIALIGENVSQSLSPRMHNLAFRRLGLSYSYEALSVAKADFSGTFSKIRQTHLGLNITIPYKEIAVRYVTHLSPAARKLKAVNTVIFFKSKIAGDNTDVDGCIESIRESGHLLKKDCPAFILGAGGASKATVEALRYFGIRHYVVASRTPNRLKLFADWFKKNYQGFTLECLRFAPSFKKKWQDQLRECTVFVNAAPLKACQSLSFFPDLSFPKGIMVVDWIYFPFFTPWLQKGEQAKGTLVPGYKLLLYQGMKSFQLWTKKEAPKEIMEKALLEGLE